MMTEPPHVAAHEIGLLVDLIAKRCSDRERIAIRLKDLLTQEETGTALGREMRKRDWLSSDN